MKTTTIGTVLMIIGLSASGACITIEEPPCNDHGGTTVVVVNTPPADQPDGGMPDGSGSGSGSDGGTSVPTGPAVPEAAPSIAVLPAPQSDLADGTLVALRFVITADAAADVQLKKLSFAIGLASAGGSVGSPHLRLVGSASDLPASADMIQTVPGHCGDLIDAQTYPCYRISLTDPLVIDAGPSVTLDLRVYVQGQLATGDTLTSVFYADFHGHEEGTLLDEGSVSTHIKGSSYEDADLWSNDDVWYYNGYDVVGINTGWTLTR